MKEHQGIQKISYGISFVSLFAILYFHLLPALLSGLMIYVLILQLSPYLQKKTSSKMAKLLTIAFLSGFMIGGVFLLGFAVMAFFKSEVSGSGHLLKRSVEIIESAKASLPNVLDEYLPSDVTEIRERLSETVRSHFSELRIAGSEVLRVFVQMILAMVIGAMLSFHTLAERVKLTPLSTALTDRTRRFRDAFHDIVFAQVKISLVNTILTGIYLALLLPLLGIKLPLIKTLILITFFAGLLPVLGNLISNTAIVIASLSVSFNVAVGSLVFLVVIHKLEYLLNARIIGARINAKAWELLIAMLVMESIFGIAGLIAAPIYYNYIKNELSELKLI